MHRLALILALVSFPLIAADIIIADFEGEDYGSWFLEGSAFGAGPATGSVGRQKPSKGIIGKGHANSFHGDDLATGTLTSPSFILSKPHLVFSLAGGDHKGQTCLNLIIADQVVRSAAANRETDFQRYFWNLAEFAGKEARIQIVDAHSGSWGCISADHIVLADKKPARAKPASVGKEYEFVASDLGKAPLPEARLKSAPPAPPKPVTIASENFTLPSTLVANVFADVSMVMNPVALCFDPKGRLYVAETHRWHKFAENQGVFDNRTRRWWVAEDLASTSTADRLAMYQRWESKFPLDAYREHSERIIRLADTDGDGKADQRSVFADGFNDPLDGPGIGLIHGHGQIYYTCIPHLWALKDADDDGVAETRTSLQEGFGTRVGISGHDMHGLIWGPDGKLYFSIGDRGYTLKAADGRTLRDTGGGAVFRCDPDGKKLEIFYHNLRNPQELAFDQFGNLFTVDNNMGGVDKSRLNYLIEGGDTGWSTGHQQFREFRKDLGLDDFGGTSAWEAERLWDLQHEGQRAWILPPVAHITNGPAGLVFNSGHSFGERYHHRFFVCDFRGGASRSFIRAFGVEPKGAGFDIVDPHTFYGGIACADIDIGPDGKIYLADYAGTGATTLDAGNIVTIHDPVAIKDWKPEGGLYSAHMRARQRAQFALVSQGKSEPLSEAAAQATHRLARLHGIWGLGQLKRADEIRPYITDPDLEVRHAAIKTLGDLRDSASAPAIHVALIDNSHRVRAAAAIALGKLKHSDAVPTLIALIEANADRDLFLRHALVMALVGIGPDAAANSANRSVRLAALLAYRKLRSPRIADFLADPDPFIVAEAAAACNDLLIIEALAALRPETASRMTWVRILNANYRLGSTDHAKAILAIAADSATLRVQNDAHVPEGVRLDAIWYLAHWPGESGIDPSVGLIRPLTTERPPIADAISEELLALLKTAKGKVRAEATRLAGQLEIPLDPESLIATLRDIDSGLDVRLEVMSQLTAQQPPNIANTFHALTRDKDALIRHAALRALADTDPALASITIRRFIESTDLRERQAGFRTLGHIQHPEASNQLLAALAKLTDGSIQQGLALDVYEACELRK
ncbi:MAG: quinoprotein glucose dehydrogenase, partial [Rhodothermales bacterium]